MDITGDAPHRSVTLPSKSRQQALISWPFPISIQEHGTKGHAIRRHGLRKPYSLDHRTGRGRSARIIAVSAPCRAAMTSGAVEPLPRFPPMSESNVALPSGYASE